MGNGGNHEDGGGSKGGKGEEKENSGLGAIEFPGEHSGGGGREVGQDVGQLSFGHIELWSLWHM